MKLCGAVWGRAPREAEEAAQARAPPARCPASEPVGAGRLPGVRRDRHRPRASRLRHEAGPRGSRAGALDLLDAQPRRHVPPPQVPIRPRRVVEGLPPRSRDKLTYPPARARREQAVAASWSPGAAPARGGGLNLLGPVFPPPPPPSPPRHQDMLGP